ncbi:unnamed protein product [Amoebophrya sp. A120]|nr:unnamed protein product [Amoebophrya sp. A120]|eukprot:GSA120T00019140001.1
MPSNPTTQKVQNSGIYVQKINDLLCFRRRNMCSTPFTFVSAVSRRCHGLSLGCARAPRPVIKCAACRTVSTIRTRKSGFVCRFMSSCYSRGRLGSRRALWPTVTRTPKKKRALSS